MAIIRKKLVTERETASYKLDCSTIALLRSYAEFIGSPQEHVVNQALLYIFRKDRDFALWLKSNGKPDLFPAVGVAATDSPNKERRRTVAAGASPGTTGSKS